MKSRTRLRDLSQLSPPTLKRQGEQVVLSGDWSLFALRPRLLRIRAQLALQARGAVGWDLAGVSRLDSFGALLLWRCWGRAEPEGLVLDARQRAAFARIQDASRQAMPASTRDWLWPVRHLGELMLGVVSHLLDFAAMLGMVVLEVLRLVIEPRSIPLREFSAALYKTGLRAMPVSAMVGFLIGVVLCYLSAMQLRIFGAEALIINILGIGIIRELGPVLVSILVAGRSGSAITAQLGVMRVTEEIDALAAMGISRYQRLVFPKVLAMAFSLPLLVAWTSLAALMGGMACAYFLLDIEPSYFFSVLPNVVPAQNLYISLAKGVVFGVAIALVACHFGLRVKPNTESLSANTTASVVSSITAVILLDAVFAVLMRNIGMPFR